MIGPQALLSDVDRADKKIARFLDVAFERVLIAEQIERADYFRMCRRQRFTDASARSGRVALEGIRPSTEVASRTLVFAQFPMSAEPVIVLSRGGYAQ